jgi:hypothetical protein
VEIADDKYLEEAKLKEEKLKYFFCEQLLHGTVQISEKQNCDQEGDRMGEAAQSFFSELLIELWEDLWEMPKPTDNGNCVGEQKFIVADHREVGNIHEHINGGRDGDAAEGGQGEHTARILIE